MSLPLNATLQSIREQVLLRCGYAVSGNQSAGVTPMVDAMIAGAERELFPECNWLNAKTRTTVTLTALNNVIDWPDDSEPGRIEQIGVVRSDTGYMTEVFPGTMLNERNEGDLTTDGGQPILYEFLDQQIYIQPAPSTDYTSLVITYYRAPNLVQDSDRCVVDPECLIQRSVFKFKEYLELPIGQVELSNHERYLARLKAANSSRGGFVMGGHKSWMTEVQRRNRVTKNSNAWGRDINSWNPW